MLAATLIPENASRAHRPLDDLGLSERKLVDDAMAMMALIFTRQGGARAIVDHFYYSGEQPFTSGRAGFALDPHNSREA